jgi:membrane protein implicated in regulation of membrane protease activity
MNNGSGLAERVLTGALCVLAAAYALRAAVNLLLSVLWQLVGLALAGAVVIALWTAWRSRRDGW